MPKKENYLICELVGVTLVDGLRSEEECLNVTHLQHSTLRSNRRVVEISRVTVSPYSEIFRLSKLCIALTMQKVRRPRKAP